MEPVDTPTTRKRLTPEQRRSIIIEAGVDLARKRGDLLMLTVHDVAANCRITTAPITVRHYFRTIDALRDAVGEAMRR